MTTIFGENEYGKLSFICEKFCGRQFYELPRNQRAKTREDAASIAGLARTIWTEHYTPIIGSSQVEYMLENIQSAEKIAEAMESGSEYYMAYLYDRLIGYMAIHEDSESMVLSKLYIEKDFEAAHSGSVYPSSSRQGS